MLVDNKLSVSQKCTQHYWGKCCHQVKGRDYSSVLNTGETMSGVMSLVLVSPLQDMNILE